MNGDAEQQEIAAGALVFARPHFRREGNDLFFFLSNRPYRHLSRSEAAIWDSLLSGPAPMKSFQDRSALDALVDASLVEIVEPVQARDRKRILVIEPHCDDAALSIGATMWKMRHNAEFDILTFASRSNYTTAFQLRRNYFDRNKVTKMRTAEGNLFSKHLGGHYHCAELPEATLRYRDSDWDLDFFNEHEVATAIFNNRRGSPSTLALWVQQLRAFLNGRTFDEIWIPLGAGTHSDHDLARNAALRTLVELQPSAVVRLYEDVPYGAEFEEHTKRILRSLAEAGASLKPWWQDVTEEFATKLHLLSIFASQFKVASIQGGVERNANEAGTWTERLWTLETLPHHLPEDQMWIGAPDVDKIRARIPRFLKGANAERRLAIFAITAAGRWSEDLAQLRKAFPAARFVIYAGPRVSAEFRELQDEGVEVHCHSGRLTSWLKAALREVFTGHRIIIAGEALVKARRLGLIWQTGQKLTCSAMDHLIQALQAG